MKLENAKKWESLDLQINLTPQKDQKTTSLFCIHDEPISTKLLFIDLPVKEAHPDYKFMTLSELTQLKENKKEFKKLIKEYLLVTDPTYAAKILKLVGKLMQLYNKAPIMVTPNLKISQLHKRQYFRMQNNRVQCKLGYVHQGEQVLKNRLDKIMEAVKLKNPNVISYFTKTTHGCPTY